MRPRITELEEIAVPVSERTTWLFLRLGTNVGVTGLAEASLGNARTLPELARYWDIAQGLDSLSIADYRRRAFPTAATDLRHAAAASAVEHALCRHRRRRAGLLERGQCGINDAIKQRMAGGETLFVDLARSGDLLDRQRLFVPIEVDALEGAGDVDRLVAAEVAVAVDFDRGVCAEGFAHREERADAVIRGRPDGGRFGVGRRESIERCRLERGEAGALGRAGTIGITLNDDLIAKVRA